ncbi:DUF4123 domain-containing protein [Xenorhabdus szentirmaii]|uniref:DUF4123 domain-containing protein n=1 Tax=Xenorhabdus szentirmaii DSM 16338 TaxID=1427518 RepID=W1IWW8_9GAMM|nr:DUF4123 domain-containing protein [Xenorhabdus szentirmaii]PHM35225.1 hypothetical protein Xsze_01692 [Xenorhabdus szentirmaii DSM 16338]PHM44026.1 hypothetical protein Xszus_03850 [Xenorhabdus szentirmaii]CDL82116.1 conserved hypothetical protein [Xenorhabdus szentirmaii DSM 16338]
MTMEIRQQWLEKIEQSCATMNLNTIDIIVDQTGLDDSIIPALQRMQPEIQWFTLFDGKPEEGLLDQAPLLIRVQLDCWQHKNWLHELIDHFCHTSRLLLLISPMPFEPLCKILQYFSDVQWGEQSCLLRFYDPRVFPKLLAEILTPEQRELFLDIAFVWSWLDRDNQIAWKLGTFKPNMPQPDQCTPLVFDDRQFELIGCITDAEKLLKSETLIHHDLPKEHYFSYYYQTAIEANKKGYLGDLADYISESHGENNERGF